MSILQMEKNVIIFYEKCTRISIFLFAVSLFRDIIVPAELACRIRKLTFSISVKTIQTSYERKVSASDSFRF